MDHSELTQLTAGVVLDLDRLASTGVLDPSPANSILLVPNVRHDQTETSPEPLREVSLAQASSPDESQVDSWSSNTVSSKTQHGKSVAEWRCNPLPEDHMPKCVSELRLEDLAVRIPSKEAWVSSGFRY